MTKHFSDLFNYLSLVMCSDDDQPMIMEIFAGFNLRNELTISIEYTDYEDRRYNCSTAAVVNTDDARAMARRHKVDYYSLPRFISECMKEWQEIINPTFNQVCDCFKEITECLLDEGCRFRIIRTTGKNDSICC